MKKRTKTPSTKKSSDVPKQRTRQHVIASLSVNHVERIIYEQNYSAERVQTDYGYDLTVSTYDGLGYLETGFILLQLKATDTITKIGKGEFVSFTILVSDYKSWIEEAYPVFLIVYDAPAQIAYWLYIQKYFADDKTRAPKKGAASVTVRLPITHVLAGSTIGYMRQQKTKLMKEFVKVRHD